MRSRVLLLTACLALITPQPGLAQETQTKTAEKSCGTLFDFVAEAEISFQLPAVVSPSRLDIKTPPIQNPGMARKFMSDIGLNTY